MTWLRRLMYGRYGADQLNFFLLTLYVLFYLLSALFRQRILSWLSILLLAVAFWRMFSRQVDRRRAENNRFLERVRPIVRWYNAFNCRRKDKDHAYFRCPNCGQRLRVPKGKGRIFITCRSCGVSFEEKT